MSGKNIFAKWFKSKSYRQVLIFGYLTIMLICVMINLLSQSYTVNIVQKEYTKSNEMIVDRIISLCERDFKSVESTASLLANSNSAKIISKSTDDTLRRDSTHVRNMINEISLCSQASGYFSDCYVLFKNLDICLTGNGKLSKRIAFESFFKNYSQSIEQWESTVFSYPQKRTYQVFPEKNEVWLIYYSHEYIYTSNIAVLIKLNPDILGKDFSTQETGSNSIFCIFNEHNTLIYSNAPNAQIGTQIDDLTDENGDLYSDKKYFIHNVDNDTHTRHYQYLMPKSAVIGKVKHYKILYTLTCLLCIGISIAMTFLLVKASYRPIDSLLNKLGSFEHKGTSEFAFIHDKLNEYAQAKWNLEKDINNTTKYTRNNLLKQILSGELQPQNYSTDFYTKNGLHFNGKAYAVAVINIIDIGDLAENGNDDSTELGYLVISNVFSELLEDDAYSAFVEMDGSLVCVVTFTNVLAYQEYLKQKIVKTADFLCENMSLSFSCGFSEIKNDCNELPVMYDQAVELIALSEQTLDHPCVFYSDVMVPVSFNYSEAEDAKLYNLVKICDGERVQTLIHYIFDTNIKENKIGTDLQRMLFFNMLGTILKASADNSEKDSGETVEMPNFRLTSAAQIRESIDILCKFAHNLCIENAKHLESQSKEMMSSKRKADSIRQYIENNFNNSNLNVNMIANQFNLSASHISRLFKENENTGIANYIVHCRINKAKMLLETTADSVSTIAEATGFTNVNMLIRTFKKSEGITPGQYRLLSHN